MVREVLYDEVFDGQKHYRSILDSMARPGKINRLEPVRLEPVRLEPVRLEPVRLETPPGLNTASALVAFALMDADSTFDVVNMPHGEGPYLSSNTNARRTEVEDAHFIFARANEAPDFLDAADCGSLLYPDTSATLILQVGHAAATPLPDAWRLTLEGPGIHGRTDLYVQGVNTDLLLALQARNAEFPLGLDAILTFVDSMGAPCAAALPRTTRVAWEKC
jgi:alpha-D-ribose 1-methylphosphonate 5-triphosphate synthase subunit PhnH